MQLPSSAVGEILQLARIGCKIPSPRGPLDFDFSSVVDVVAGGSKVRIYSSEILNSVIHVENIHTILRMHIIISMIASRLPTMANT